jgi:hypothetical protein
MVRDFSCFGVLRNVCHGLFRWTVGIRNALSHTSHHTRNANRVTQCDTKYYIQYQSDAASLPQIPCNGFLENLDLQHVARLFHLLV